MPATGAGADFSRVRAIWSNHTGDPVLKHDDLDATVLIGDVHGRIRLSSVTAPDTFTVTVRGTRGTAETDLFQPHLRVVDPAPGRQAADAAGEPVGERRWRWRGRAWRGSGTR